MVGPLDILNLRKSQNHKINAVFSIKYDIIKHRKPKQILYVDINI